MKGLPSEDIAVLQTVIQVVLQLETQHVLVSLSVLDIINEVVPIISKIGENARGEI